MAEPLSPQSSHVLTDTEVEELRSLARQHASAELTSEEAHTTAHQLLRILAIVRDVARRSSSASFSPVDGQALPDSGIRAITTLPPN